MSDNAYNDPKLAISKVYTKTGDSGKTSLVGGQRVEKYHPLIEAYGTTDELNAYVGAVCCSVQAELAESEKKQWFLKVLVRVQHELFNLGSILATLPEDIHPKQARVQEADVLQLEKDIDAVNDQLSLLRSFVLPGGSRSNADLHVCRTVCRRAERILIHVAETHQVDPVGIRYLNRLSDAFFVWSRWVNHEIGCEEVLWEPNKAASGGAN